MVFKVGVGVPPKLVAGVTTAIVTAVELTGFPPKVAVSITVSVEVVPGAKGYTLEGTTNSGAPTVTTTVRVPVQLVGFNTSQ